MRTRHSVIHRIVGLALVASLAPGAATAVPPQDAAQIRRLFESGRYADVVASVAPDVDPAVLYLAALSQQRLDAAGARTFYERLSRRAADDPWRSIGLSGLQLLEKDVDGAVMSAREAIAVLDALPEAHYQLGLALAQQRTYRDAAVAFERAAALAPTDAYAHYYAGLMHARSNRVDRMANYFERFLALAPEAPERPEVIQIMRTVRGR